MYPTNIKPSLLACSIALTLTPAAYAAQELTALEEVVVSATRTEQAVKDVSSSVASVSSQSMESQLATDPQQALKYTPGVEVQGHGRFGISDYNIRGTEGDKIKVMVDGVEQASPYNPGATEQRHYPGTVEVDSLTAIEVNKGPSSTLYGSDALGGAVLFKTKDPSDVLVTDGNENRFGIKSGYTSADETFKNTATWAMRQDDLETLLIVTYADGSETETHGSGADVAGGERGAADPADKKIGNLLGKVYYRLNDNHRIGLVAEYYQRRYDEQELHYDGYSIMMPGSGMPMITYADNYNKDNVSRLRVGVNHEWTMSNVMADSLKWSLNYQQSDSEYKNYDTSTGMMGSGKRMRYRDAGDDLIQFDAQFDKLAEFANSYHQFTYGLTYIHDQFALDNTDYKYDLGTVTPGSTGVPDATLQKWGLFLQDQAFFLDETLVLTAGVRYDGFRTDPEADEQFDTDYPSNSEDAITGKLGAVYHISNHFSTFAQISQGFKAPSVEDLYYYYNQGAIFNPNPDLKAEKSLAYELGFRGYSDVGRFEISAFYNDYTDFIDGYNTGEQQDGKDVYTTENIANAEIYGIEFSSTVNLDAAFNAPRGLYSKFSVAYAEGRDKDKDVHLDSVAPLTGVVGIGYDSLNRNYGGLVNVTMVASKDDWSDETVEAVSGYTLVDLTAYYRPINDLTLRAGLFNAFDKKYWLYSDMESGYSTASRDFYSQPGRNWGVSLDYQF
ncbi:TonB-dependent hemoglobin/transferrin/lactoferrin family receptor [Vibrio gangliei]|uniref:TonB-dependent hemoglobin/transferrin/lactoferrin family receptor n=1 Tax=Vibrio gangliei TaxID=2077090 RepID=UPI000D017118|nr:TonB-dependent hemoglobin/transferrin/lactoferrin family receptor [Vibrio gangliei]